jgi:hypothetical protein
MHIARAEVIPLEVPLAWTFYGGTYSMHRRCTLLLRVWTAEGGCSFPLDARGEVSFSQEHTIERLRRR